MEEEEQQEQEHEHPQRTTTPRDGAANEDGSDGRSSLTASLHGLAAWTTETARINQGSTKSDMATWDMKTFSPPHFGELALPTHHLPPTPAGPPDWLRLWWRPTALSNRGPTARQGLLASSVVVLGCGSVGALPLRRRRSCARACTGARGNVALSSCMTAGAHVRPTSLRTRAPRPCLFGWHAWTFFFFES